MSEPPTYSVAIETSCRAGGLALARGEELVRVVRFDASYRQATQLILRLDELLRPDGLRPQDIAGLYVSVGPGSFTGLRVGVTVARTLAQAVALDGRSGPGDGPVSGLRLVAVPTLLAVAENARDLEWEHLGVVMDHKEGEIYAAVFARGTGEHPLRVAGVLPASTVDVSPAETGAGAAVGAPRRAAAEDADSTPHECGTVLPIASFLARAPRPIVLIGEALEFAEMQGEGVSHAPPELNLPTPEGVWRVGRRLAAGGRFTDPAHLLPLYARKPEAVRLWEKLGRA